MTPKLLREKVIEEYMKVAASFYYEGSDEKTEREEYAPKFADQLIATVLEAVKLPKGRPLNQQISYPRTPGSERGDIMHASGYNQAIEEVQELLDKLSNPMKQSKDRSKR